MRRNPENVDATLQTLQLHHCCSDLGAVLQLHAPQFSNREGILLFRLRDSFQCWAPEVGGSCFAHPDSPKPQLVRSDDDCLATRRDVRQIGRLPMIFALAPGAFIVVYAVVAYVVFRRLKAKRRLEAPEEFCLLKIAGDSLRTRIDELMEKAMSWICGGGLAGVTAFVVPLMLHRVFPSTNIEALFWSAASLSLAVSIVVVRRVVAILNELSNVRLGYHGELRVAEELQAVVMKGCRVYHDVPMVHSSWTANIDHVVVGPHGVTVIETKTRSKPMDRGNKPVEVTYDGKCLNWPRCSNDTKTIDQVKRCSDWLSRLILDQVKTAAPVDEVIAIPGWKVGEQQRTSLRVVSAKGVADAVLYAAGERKPERLTPNEQSKICGVLDALCRTTKY